jgi:RsbT co-antagonist protein rsbRD N-terminal domain
MYLSSKLIDLISNKSYILAEQWARKVKKNKNTKHYGELSHNELINRAENVYSSLGKWLHQKISKDEKKKIYCDLGKRRFQEGFNTIEITIAAFLIKSVLWEMVQDERFDSAYDLRGELELLIEVTTFFDQTLVYTLKGFEEEKNKGVSPNKKSRKTKAWFAIKT